MADRLFITGANGFVGRHLVEQLRHQAFEQVTCLSTRSHPDNESVNDGSLCRWVTGDIRDPRSTSEHLEGVDTVVHLAALTGKQRAEDHFSVNAEGTRILLESCHRAGVRRFLHVSTIAVKFRDTTHYPYARSKLEAEEAVRNSSLQHTIIRPTIVVSAESPSWHAFRQLAAGPLTFVFGGGATRIQPIHVDDLVACMVGILRHDEFADTTFEIGGCEQTTMERFLSRIHGLYHQRRPTVVHIPLWPTVPCLVAAETVFHDMLPLTAGQLSPFQHDSTADREKAYPQLEYTMKSVTEMLDGILEEERHGETQARMLDRECRIFTSHLIDCQPDEYILKHYRDAHQKVWELGHSRSSTFDRAMTSLASCHPLLSRLVDTYTRVFAPTALVRKKWILLLSLLEVSASTHSVLDAPQQEGSTRVTFALLMAGVRFMFLLLLSSIAFGPLHVACISGASIRHRID